jgi:uncharacterized protein (DUF433 family)
MTSIQPNNHIELRSGLRGERPFIAGHRVRVQDVVLWDEEGLSADEIVSRVPTISLADVHAALAYYYDHRETIDRQIAEDHSFATPMEEAELPPRRRRPARRGGRRCVFLDQALRRGGAALVGRRSAPRLREEALRRKP